MVEFLEGTRAGSAWQRQQATAGVGLAINKKTPSLRGAVRLEVEAQGEVPRLGVRDRTSQSDIVDVARSSAGDVHDLERDRDGNAAEEFAARSVVVPKGYRA